MWEDFLDIFYAPSSVFARREHGSFWIPMLVVTLLLGILVFVNSGVNDPMMEAEMARGMARADDPRVTEEAMAQMRGVTATIGKITAVISTPFVILFVALATWVAAKLIGAKQTWHAALVVAAYSYVPRVLEAVLTGVLGLFVDPAHLDGAYRMRLGFGWFLDPDTTSPLMIALLGRIDVFTIWITVLLAIGVAVTGRVDRGRAILAGVIIWVLGGLPAILGAVAAALRG